ncbi:hypothetical protein PF011_g2031, partial [Phytophthora fragariae]
MTKVIAVVTVIDEGVAKYPVMVLLVLSLEEMEQ